MIPNNFGIKLEPLELTLKLDRETMVFLTGLSVLVLVYGVKRLKRG
jgi:hypothetical protein